MQVLNLGFRYRADYQTPDDLTILQMIQASHLRLASFRNASCWLSDPTQPHIAPVLIAREDWHRVRPKQGIEVTFRIRPTGGGGQKSGLGLVLRIVTVVLAAAATAYLGGAGGPLVAAGWSATAAGVAGAAAGAAIPIAGMLAISRTIPSKPRPQFKEISR